MPKQCNVIVGCFLRGLQSPTETHCGQVRAQARNWRSLRRPKGLLLNAPPSIHFSPPSIHFAVSAPHFDSFFSGKLERPFGNFGPLFFLPFITVLAVLNKPVVYATCNVDQLIISF